jgi:hypothetical protein
MDRGHEVIDGSGQFPNAPIDLVFRFLQRVIARVAWCAPAHYFSGPSDLIWPMYVGSRTAYRENG